MALLALSTQSSQAGSVQHIDCRFPNPASTDHVIVSLENPRSGTFFYTTGISDDEEEQTTGSISLHQEEDSKDPNKKDFSRYRAAWTSIQDGSKVTVDFHFSMPKSLVFKASDSFKAGFTTSINDQSSGKHPLSLTANDELTCFSRLYPSKK